MKFRPGKNLLLFVAGIVVLMAGTFIMPELLWVAAGLCVAILPVLYVEFSRLRCAVNGIQVSRIVPGRVARGRAFKVTVEVTSDVPSGLHGVMRDELPPAAHCEARMHEIVVEQGTNDISYFTTIPQRGLHRFGTTWIRVTGGFSLLEAQKGWSAADTVKVLPQSLVPDEELKKDALDERRLLDQVMQSRQRGEGTEFESLSEYREGDEVRRIDWRSSARVNRLIMRRFQVERHRDVVILLDCGRLMGTASGSGTKLDCAVDAALVISRVALKGGDRCGVGVFDSRVRGYLSPVAGVAAHNTLVERLYDVKVTWMETDFAPMFAALQTRQVKRSMIIVLSDMMEMETTQRYRAALLSLRSRHVVLFAALRTPLLAESAQTPVENAQDVARSTFALRLMKEREQTLHSLSRNGIKVLDVEPRELTVPLVNMFLEAKQNTVA